MSEQTFDQGVGVETPTFGEIYKRLQADKKAFNERRRNFAIKAAAGALSLAAILPWVPEAIKTAGKKSGEIMDDTAVAKMGSDVLRIFSPPETFGPPKKIEAVQPGDIDPFPNRPPDNLKQFCEGKTSYEFIGGDVTEVPRMVHGLMQMYYDGQFSVGEIDDHDDEKTVMTKITDLSNRIMVGQIKNMLDDPRTAEQKISTLSGGRAEGAVVSDGEAMMEIITGIEKQYPQSRDFFTMKKYWRSVFPSLLAEKNSGGETVYSDQSLDLALLRRAAREQKTTAKSGFMAPVVGAIRGALGRRKPQESGLGVVWDEVFDEESNDLPKAKGMDRRTFLKILGGGTLALGATLAAVEASRMNSLSVVDTFAGLALKGSEKTEIQKTIGERIGRLFASPLVIEGVTKFLYDDGTPMAEIVHKDRDPIKFNEIPRDFIDFLVATEDADFWQHNGVSSKSTLRALINRESGGSTLTQQVVKRLCWSDEENAAILTSSQQEKKKIAEIFMAAAFETFLVKKLGTKQAAKEQILELYANLAPMGAGVSGLKRAADYYFGKAPNALTMEQCAFLAGMPQGPAIFDPYLKTSDIMKNKQSYVDARIKEGTISSEQYTWIKTQKPEIQALKARQAIAFNLYSRSHPEFDAMRALQSDLGFLSEGKRRVAQTASENAQYCARYINQLLADIAPKAISNGSVEITTTINPFIQRNLETIIEAKKDQILKSGGTNLAIFVRDEQGNVLASAGDVSTSLPSGSTLKPVLYTQAFATGIADPASFEPLDGGYRNAQEMRFKVKRFGDKLSDAKDWVVTNFQSLGHGAVSWRKALSQSWNMAAVDTVQKVGCVSYARALEKSGAYGNVDSKFLKNFHWVDVLGPGSEGHGISVARVAQVGAVLNDGGTRVGVAPISQIKVDGEDIYKRQFGASPRSQRVFSSGVVKEIVGALSDDNNRPINDPNESVRETWKPFSHAGAVNPEFWGKTGTAESGPNDPIYCWTYGGVIKGNKKYTVVAFMLADKNSSGLKAVAPIWRDVIDYMGK